ncbi:MAG: holo-ACP synthase [Planctomycetes bacterium]|nr:holo-ACP synthase [Planctomycetota bacterium]
MIVGLGLDLIGVERIRGVHARQGRRFLDRVYTADEQRYCLGFRDPAERLAARWAAKEACMKALGTGWAQGVSFTDIAVTTDGSGAPGLLLTGGAGQRAESLGVVRQLLTLSHSDGIAAAVVVLESN